MLLVIVYFRESHISYHKSSVMKLMEPLIRLLFRDTLSAKMFEFLDSDTLLYFAGESGSLLESQCRHWLPIVKWAKEEKHLDLQPSENLMDPPHISDQCRIELKKWLDSYNFGALNAICVSFAKLCFD